MQKKDIEFEDSEYYKSRYFDDPNAYSKLDEIYDELCLLNEQEITDLLKKSYIEDHNRRWNSLKHDAHVISWLFYINYTIPMREGIKNGTIRSTRAFKSHS
jgi:hypothetical protein